MPESFVISTLEQIYQPINNYELFLWDRNTNWDLNLNEENYERYFYNYACSQEGLQTLPGWLETEEPLTILVTSKLRESQWEKWLATAEEKRRTLNYYLLKLNMCQNA
ncbi:MAG: hypothetical protein HWD59_09765 [Coxiellaceae bacterium]|nr:MAG: hypothetical protein HWD59_09765 [Coxiellaceae bacterium]